MPRMIRDGAIVEDSRDQDDILSLDQWQQLENRAGTAVQLQPDQPPAPLLEHLAEIELVVVNFTAFMDGRGFSYGRELRERGFTGELRASGAIIRDQLHYLLRCGFNAFEFDGDIDLEEACASLRDFSEHYQAAIDEPLPLFRRRA